MNPESGASSAGATEAQLRQAVRAVSSYRIASRTVRVSEEVSRHSIPPLVPLPTLDPDPCTIDHLPCIVVTITAVATTNHSRPHLQTPPPSTASSSSCLPFRQKSLAHLRIFTHLRRYIHCPPTTHTHSNARDRHIQPTSASVHRLPRESTAPTCLGSFTFSPHNLANLPT